MTGSGFLTSRTTSSAHTLPVLQDGMVGRALLPVTVHVLKIWGCCDLDVLVCVGSRESVACATDGDEGWVWGNLM